MSEILEISKWTSRERTDNALEAMMPMLMATTVKANRGRMPQIMAELMPKCLETLLPNLSKKERMEFALQLVSIIVDKGTVRMSEEEREDFVSRLEKEIRS